LGKIRRIATTLRAICLANSAADAPQDIDHTASTLPDVGKRTLGNILPMTEREKSIKEETVVESDVVESDVVAPEVVVPVVSGAACAVPAGTAVSSAPGHVIGGKYKILSILGSGGMGTVFRVQQVFLNKDYALKRLECGKISDVAIRRFQMEARAASLLNHPNLVQVHDFGLLDNEQPYLVMDFVDGTTLADYLSRHGPMELKKAAALFIQVCFGLAYAHKQGVVHRDIKPSNIMLVDGVPEGTEGCVKVVDFGIAKLVKGVQDDTQDLTRTGELVGSPIYMSPEQCLGGQVDQRSDVYSVGCALFETLTGTPPYLGHSSLQTMMQHQSEGAPTLKEASLGKEFPAGIEQVVSKMLRKSPQERYSDLTMVAHDLAGAVKGVAISEPHPQKKVSAKPERVLSISTGRLCLLLATTIVITALTTVILDHVLNPRTSQSTGSAAVNPVPVPQLGGPIRRTNELSDRAKQNEKLSIEKMPRITSKLKIIGGERKKEFVFPDEGLGWLITWDKYGSVTYGAQKTVLVSDGAFLTLSLDWDIYPLALRNPAILGKIAPDIFGGLKVMPPEITSDFEHSLSQAKLNDNVVSVLEIASKWSKLELVGLTDVSVSKPLLSALDHMNHLRILELKKPQAVPQDWPSEAFFSRLEVLSLREFEAENLLLKFSGSTNLRYLLLSDVGLSPDVVNKLSSCPNLQYLRLVTGETATEFSDSLLESVIQLKSLRTFCSVNAALTPKQIKMLADCPWIKKVIVLRKPDSVYEECRKGLGSKFATRDEAPYGL
jgi:serine/threonine protein kinase